MGQLGIITGLVSETDCLGGIADPAFCRVRCAGADGERAAALSKELVRQGCAALLSFGVAGGLDPRLPSGHLVLAERVVGDGQYFDSDASWVARARAMLAVAMPVTVGTLIGVKGPVASADDKQQLYAATGAAAVDMESHAVAAAARERGLPFLAIRVIADTASQSVPRWLPAVIDEKGGVALSVFFKGLAAHPADLAGVFRLAGANRRSLDSLRRAAALLGPRLGLL